MVASRLTVPVAAVLLPLLGITGCTYLRVAKVVDGQTPPPGTRYFLPKPLLLVEPDGKGGINVDVIYVPDPNAEYAIDAYAFMAKQQLDLDIANGLLTSVKYVPDSTELAKALAESTGNVTAAAIKASAARDAAREAETKTAETALQGKIAELATAEKTVGEARLTRDDALKALQAFVSKHNFETLDTNQQTRSDLEAGVRNAERDVRAFDINNPTLDPSNPNDADEIQTKRELEIKVLDTQKALDDYNAANPVVDIAVLRGEREQLEAKRDAAERALATAKVERDVIKKQQNNLINSAKLLATVVGLPSGILGLLDELEEGTESVVEVSGPLFLEIVETGHGASQTVSLEAVSWDGFGDRLKLKATRKEKRAEIAWDPKPNDTCQKPSSTEACDVTPKKGIIDLKFTLNVELGVGSIGDGQSVFIEWTKPATADSTKGSQRLIKQVGEEMGFQVNSKVVTILLVTGKLWPTKPPAEFEVIIKDGKSEGLVAKIKITN